ncbi:MAG: KH domain-containing protein [Armatimonadetes bacterium]|nr:MAG: KH domain-containing protein [Armatimonadota bacterium]GIV01329.1 MAG: UPF0109 protein [Fimbriimonadales bacterium]
MGYGEFVEYCVKGLVANPEAVDIEVIEEGDAYVVRIKTDPEDVGKVIGKNGRLITAIRSIVSAAAEKKGEKAFVKVLTDSDE